MNVKGRGEFVGNQTELVQTLALKSCGRGVCSCCIYEVNEGVERQRGREIPT